jgi:hypothetical protein
MPKIKKQRPKLRTWELSVPRSFFEIANNPKMYVHMCHMEGKKYYKFVSAQVWDCGFDFVIIEFTYEKLTNLKSLL